ncbi:MAG: hypothetical protein PHI11_11145 [Gallionella sp.]|nr:hypothetical protein [Gallionella sp.]
MNTITSLFQQAQLAEAAYANFFDKVGNLIIDKAGVVTALVNNDFSQAQAAAFVADWTVVDQYTATGWYGATWIGGTGFSATLFKNKTGQYNLSIRGSTAANDFLADTTLISSNGIAVNQTVDMYNYWQRLTHQGTYTVAKLTLMSAESTILGAFGGFGSVLGVPWATIPQTALEYVLGIGVPFDPVSAPYDVARAFFNAAGYVVEGGNVYKIESDTSTNFYTDPADPRRVGINVPGLSSVNVDGHSLGGHLAMAFSRLFPSATNSATAVNGLGFTMSDAANDADYVIARRAT